MKRIAPALGLLFLSPLVAEFLLGNLPITSLYASFALALVTVAWIRSRRSVDAIIQV
jgi:hypothetical protein